jgi:iron complex transport system substrate-binding protein
MTSAGSPWATTPPSLITIRWVAYTDGTLAGALYFISPLSLPYVLERLTPQLEAAVAGKAPQRVVVSR